MPNIKNWGIIKFFTKTVVILILLGVIFIILGQSKYLTQNYPTFFRGRLLIVDTIMTSLGTALLGGGVFSALVQSQDFLKIYKGVFEDVVWSKEFLKKRGDIRHVWNNVSRVLYEEKFPDLSYELEEIITTEYFPTTHDFYISEYDFTVNIVDHDADFWVHEETLNLVLKPTNNHPICYKQKSEIDFPPSSITNDITDFTIIEIIVNGKNIPINKDDVTRSKSSNCHVFEYKLDLKDGSEYNVIIKRKKVLSKVTNRDKRVFATYFQKNVKVTIIAPVSIKIDFYKMGTVKNFIQEAKQENNGTKILKWYYKGIILPKQGFIIIMN